MARRSDLEADPIFIGMRAALSASYAATLRTSELSPMQSLEYLALALGALYREVADAHLVPGFCNCGWQPCDLMDVIALQQALAISGSAEAEEPALHDLLGMVPAGHG